MKRIANLQVIEAVRPEERMGHKGCFNSPENNGKILCLIITEI